MNLKEHNQKMRDLLPSVRALKWARFYDFSDRFFGFRFERMQAAHPTEAPLKIVQRLKKATAAQNKYDEEQRKYANT